MGNPIVNRYIKRAHISERKFKDVLKGFATDLTAQDVSILTNLSRNTINKIFKKMRGRILALSPGAEPFSGEIELDESYFGARRVRGKRGRGAAENPPCLVFSSATAMCTYRSSKTVVPRSNECQ